MIDPQKLFQLSGGQKRRKLALTFGALERDIAGIAETGSEYSFKSMSREQYTKELVKVLLQDPKLTESMNKELTFLLNAKPFDERRLCNVARNHLLTIIGTFPAEWDLIIAPHASCDVRHSHDTLENTSTNTITQTRQFYPGINVYAEDIRSPFNLGSIFRTAEGLGAERLYMSPFCCSEEHPRTVRSSMGCIETLPFEKCTLDELPRDKKIFVLETGGTPIDEFEFPKDGICILGSEELGASPEALKVATYGCVTIPMIGIKASLNVGVAFGILLQKWIEYYKNHYM